MHQYAPLILTIALFMEQMDSTVIATSLPAIAADLDVGPITLKLAMTSYLVALGVFIPLSGWAADISGFFMSGVGAAGLVFGLSVVSLPALPPSYGVVAVIVGVISNVMFIRHARRHPHPVLELRLFRSIRSGSA